MTMTIKELENRWNTIDPYSGGYLLISGDHPLFFHIGYHSSGQKSFVVLNTGSIDGLKSSKAITVECVESDQQFILRFVLNYPSLDEIFIKLCWDLMESSKINKNPVEQICNQYSKWMRLLQKASNDILSASQQKGLIGELLYLQELLNEIEPADAIAAWVGPEGSDQDFIFIQSWSEIKTISISATNVQISSLQQLDCKYIGYLIIYFMDKTTSRGLQTISLPKLITQIESKLSEVRLREIFQCKLTQYGYLSRDKEKYLSVNYRLAECRKYKVAENFPKLVRENILDAVVNAKYCLDLLMLDEWKI